MQNSKFSDLIDYFRTLASQHVELMHSENEKHFYRFELEEFFTGLRNLNYPALILEGYKYGLVDKLSDNVLKERSGAFMLIDHVSDGGDIDKMHEVWEQMEMICDDIVSRIKKDKRERSVPVVQGFDLNNIEVALVANMMDHSYGIRCTFNIASPLNVDIDATHWNLNVN